MVIFDLLARIPLPTYAYRDSTGWMNANDGRFRPIPTIVKWSVIFRVFYNFSSFAPLRLERENDCR